VKELRDHSEQMMRAHIAKIPDGVYAGEAFLDSDGIDPEPLAVEDNLVLGGYLARGGVDRLRERFDAVYGMFPVLRQRSRQLAETLSGGEQQMLAVGRALMGAPRLLLVDELSLGLAPVVVHELYRKLIALHRQGMTIVMVEQNARLTLRACDRAYVLSTGAVVLAGRASELMQDETVRKAYLGGRGEDW
jgi:branched-chain amino acid transport system ATP-binding protein